MKCKCNLYLNKYVIKGKVAIMFKRISTLETQSLTKVNSEGHGLFNSITITVRMFVPPDSADFSETLEREGPQLDAQILSEIFSAYLSLLNFE